MTDRKFTDSPDAGDPSCLCSRCGEMIEERDEPALRVWDAGDGGEYRYHLRCVGMKAI